jgi:hypothetical protein
MIVLDENVSDYQQRRLRAWRIRTQKIGSEIAAKGTQDDQVIPLLRSLRRPTFFSLDSDFGDARLCHPAYCLVYLDVRGMQTADYVRRVLRHPALNTQAKRMGAVVRVNDVGVRVWRRNEAEQFLPWP